MNFATSIFVINQACRMVVCEYDPDNSKDRRVNYKTLDPSVSKGDLVVVPTDTRQKFTVVKVVDVDIPVDFDQPGDIKWIVEKVDTSHFARLIEDEAVAIKTLQGAEQKRRAAEMLKLMTGEHAPDALKSLALYDDGKPAQQPIAPAPPAGGGSGPRGATITIDNEPF